MDFQLSNSDTVKYCPSVAGIVDESTYIIGCYQLVDEGKQINLSHDQLIKINNRLGCLILIKSSKVIFEYDCLDGGVFDLAVVQTDDSTNDGNHQFWAAHSNGSVACYHITNGSIKFNKSIVSGSSMLCSLTILDDLIFVGDSESKVIAIQKDKIQINVSSFLDLKIPS
uniref:Ciliary BBSome complex subunit 2 N-terminal domain-containing protein n=1 Tax=Tetranychus urticae TaxID=32264 RepID=T1JW89_TETUR